MDTLIQIGDFFVKLWDSISWFVTSSIEDAVTFGNYVKTGVDSLTSVIAFLPAPLFVICSSAITLVAVLRLVGRD